jgi:hypothetical protein
MIIYKHVISSRHLTACHPVTPRERENRHVKQKRQNEPAT